MAQFDLSSYIDTQSRVNKFWTEHESAELVGFIHTEMLSDPDNDSFVSIKASVGYYNSAGMQLIQATGIASEVRTFSSDRGQTGHNRVNETSWVENCETSAIGRAFANLGYAVSGDDRPSREEMAKVNRYDDAIQNTGAATPVAPSAPRPSGGGGGGYRPPAQRSGQTPTIQNPGAEPTEKQIKLITDMAKGQHDAIAFAMFEKEFSQINRQEASDIIGELMNAPKPAKEPVVVVIDDDGAPPPEEPGF